MTEKETPIRKEREDRRETAIVKHSNQLAEVPLQNFTAKEIDLFYGICYKVQNQGTDSVTIWFNDLRSLLGYDRRGNKKLFEDIREMSYKFSRISLLETNGKTNFKIIVPFIDFEADYVKGYFKVGVHKEFAAALNGLDGSPGRRYTLADVIGISRVKSVFSKQCLKMLFQYRNTGYWYTSLEQIRYYLDIPEKYKAGDIKRRILDKITSDFDESGLFEEFEILERKDENKTTKGRKKILGYTFRFRFVDDPAINAFYEEPPAISCPLCGKPLVKIERKDGTGFFFGHRDGWSENASCHYTTKEITEIPAEKISGVEVVGAEEEAVVTVSRRDLEKYYRHIREEEASETNRRREYIETNEPEIWNAYEERERKVADFVKNIGAFPLTEESREEKRRAQESIREYTARLSDVLIDHGYDSDYLELRYRCKECQDTGQRRDGSFCSCRKERVKEAAEWLKTN